MNYDRVCFVIMPFGTKVITDDQGTRKVAFDTIYDRIFEPAIRATTLPEGGTLEPRRCDQDFFAGVIGDEMFAYLEYSRFALTDITGLNPNVFYELGVRHRARQAGTAIFRQVGTQLPFDITQIRAFPYEYEPDTEAEKSRGIITRVLTESLQQNGVDSPVRSALRVQRERFPAVEVYLKDAENAIRALDRPRAIAAYRSALRADPENNVVRLSLGLLLKDEGDWDDALEQFTRAIEAAPMYADAYREQGVAQNKLYHKRRDQHPQAPDGIAALRRAIELNPHDYDAYASLGGALKRAGRPADAATEYWHAVDVSHGHSYPLLNALTLAASAAGRLELSGPQRFHLGRAERSLRAQVRLEPPYDAPWSLFDLAQIRLFQGAPDEFLQFAERGTECAGHAWQIETFRKTLSQLIDAGVELAGLRQGVAMLEERERFFG